jgi:two-component system, OmpR family, phosphate regulon response regulator PhoB
MEKKKILVVDDEIDMRIYISTVLKTGGYATIVTREGSDGIRKARQARPDLIVLDVMMPGEGGVKMYRQLKTDPELSDIPVIMLSAVKKASFLHYLNMLNAHLTASVAHPAAYLEKPFEPEELLSAVRSGLQPTAGIP